MTVIVPLFLFVFVFSLVVVLALTNSRPPQGGHWLRSAVVFALFVICLILMGRIAEAQSCTPATNCIKTVPLSGGSATDSNIKTLNGVTIPAGNGVSTTGTPRVNIASDNSALPVNSTLQAGSAIAGKFGIDQTTPGTTNGVQVNAALPAGTNVIGHVIADTGSTTTVTGTVTVGTHAVTNGGTFAVQENATHTDACLDPNVAKQSVSVAISSATTTQVIAPSGSTVPYVCSYTFMVSSGTTPTIQFKSGTGATCNTGTPLTLTGVMALPTASGSVVTAGWGGTLFGSTSGAITAGHGVCIVSGGTTPTFNGWITYVQR